MKQQTSVRTGPVSIPANIQVLAGVGEGVVVIRISVNRPLSRLQRLRLWWGRRRGHRPFEQNIESFDLPLDRNHALQCALAIYRASEACAPRVPATGQRPS